MGKLTDKVALITGSDSGIGQATAVEFAREARGARPARGVPRLERGRLRDRRHLRDGWRTHADGRAGRLSNSAGLCVVDRRCREHQSGLGCTRGRRNCLTDVRGAAAGRVELVAEVDELFNVRREGLEVALSPSYIIELLAAIAVRLTLWLW